MNDMPTTKGNAELALEIVRRVMAFNRTPTCKGTTGEKPTINVEFSGITNTLVVCIYKDGWEPDKKCKALHCRLSACDYISDDGVNVMLERVLDTVRDVIDEWERKRNE